MLRVPPDLPGLRVLLGLRDLPAHKGRRGLLDRLAQRARRELQGRQDRQVPRGLLVLRGQLALLVLLDLLVRQVLRGLALLVRLVQQALLAPRVLPGLADLAQRLTRFSRL